MKKSFGNNTDNGEIMTIVCKEQEAHRMYNAVIEYALKPNKNISEDILELVFDDALDKKRKLQKNHRVATFYYENGHRVEIDGKDYVFYSVARNFSELPTTEEMRKLVDGEKLYMVLDDYDYHTA